MCFLQKAPRSGSLNLSSQVYAHVHLKNVPKPRKEDRSIFLLHLHILNICEYATSVVHIISFIVIIFLASLLGENLWSLHVFDFNQYLFQ